MIPKIIHYCWFGKKTLPDLAVICIQSWKKHFPEYEIKEWNETNFDINCCAYVREAYEAGKWAFVSDYARFWILYNYGGVYFDTDVEVIKNMDDILIRGPFMAIEKNAETHITVAPGLGLGACVGMQIYKEMLDLYNSVHFKREDGTLNLNTVVMYMTEVLKCHGLKNQNTLQYVENIFVYPTDYFCPIDCSTGKKNITQNTRSIHYYTDSWGSYKKANVLNIERRFDEFGTVMHCIGRILTFPLRVSNKIQQVGLIGSIKFARRKISALLHKKRKK